MSTTFYTSDLHLGHKLMVQHRPFDSIEEHDNHIANMWTRTVRDDDIVYVLGDLSIEGSYKHALNIIRELPGRKRLITGNHDNCWQGKSTAQRYLREYQEVFELVTPWARAKVGSVKVLLSHFPYLGDHTASDRYSEYRLSDCGIPLLHGHVHSANRITLSYVDSMQIHVGVDAWDYKLVPSYKLEKLLDQRIDFIRAKNKGMYYVDAV